MPYTNLFCFSSFSLFQHAGFVAGWTKTRTYFEWSIFFRLKLIKDIFFIISQLSRFGDDWQVECLREAFIENLTSSWRMSIIIRTFFLIIYIKLCRSLCFSTVLLSEKALKHIDFSTFWSFAGNYTTHCSLRWLMAPDAFLISYKTRYMVCWCTLLLGITNISDCSKREG